eukprot:1134227-Pelagomonas_calceolata.AAC.1
MDTPVLGLNADAQRGVAHARPAGVPVIPVGQAPVPAATPAVPMDMGLMFTQMMQMSQATQQANQELLRRMEGLESQNAPHATDE